MNPEPSSNSAIFRFTGESRDSNTEPLSPYWHDASRPLAAASPSAGYSIPPNDIISVEEEYEQIRRDNADRDFKRVYAAYREAHETFYLSEQNASQIRLDNLRRKLTSDQSNDDVKILLEGHFAGRRSGSEGRDPSAAEPTPPDSFLRIDDMENNGMSSRIQLRNATWVGPKYFPRHPRYQSCAPTSFYRDLREGDTDRWIESAFLPFTDDPKFPIQEYAKLKKFQHRKWETIDDDDPDFRLIHFQTMCMLVFHEDDPLTIDRIDATEVLPLSRGDRIKWLPQNSFGVFWTVKQRDLDFGDSSHMRELGHRIDSIIRNETEPRVDDLLGRLDRFVRLFCSNLNCIVSYCSYHVRDFELPVQDNKPKVLSSRFHELVRDACGQHCFKHVEFTPDVQMLLFDRAKKWGRSDRQALRCYLKFCPDMIPCELAVAVRRPCLEVYACRANFLTDEKIKHADVDHGPKRGNGIFVDDSVKRKEKNVKPCNHPGRCDGLALDCECYRRQQHCERTCRCSLDCQRRWRGCNKTCKRDGGAAPCQAQKCACIKASRECDADLCTRCHARSSITKAKNRCCQNVSIQRGDIARLEIKTGKFGLGAFSTTRILKYDYIGEYVAEVEHGHLERDMIMRKFLPNYMFTVTDSLILDALHLGNETRFINDFKGTGFSGNCDALIYQVNGDGRIALYATQEIKRGQELFFSYGDEYWAPHENEETGAQEDDAGAGHTDSESEVEAEVQMEDSASLADIMEEDEVHLLDDRGASPMEEDDLYSMD